MINRYTAEEIIAKICKISSSGPLEKAFAYEDLKKYVLKIHIDDIVAQFENPGLEYVVAELSSFFVTAEAFPDKEKFSKFELLCEILKCEPLTVERLVYAFDKDRIILLKQKFDSQIIDEKIFKEQLKKLSVARFEVDVVLDLVDKFQIKKSGS